MDSVHTSVNPESGHSRLATILYSMAAWEEFAKEHREQASQEFARLLKEKQF